MFYYTKNENFDSSQFDFEYAGMKYMSIHVRPGDFEGGKTILYTKTEKFLVEAGCNAATNFEITHENIVEWSHDANNNTYPVKQYMLMTASFNYGTVKVKRKTK